MGRWVVSAADAKAAYCGIPDAARRSTLWSHWETITNGLRQAVGHVPACWMSGSFFTDKDQPGDLDCLYVLDRDDVAAARTDPRKALVLQDVASSGFAAKTGVQTFVLDWWPRAGTIPGSADRQRTYLEPRGYWDDLWTRRRRLTGEPPRIGKIPQRGYLEVIVDGYR